jgi:hypothetical protein
MRAILLDATNTPIGSISNEVSFVTASQWPSLPVTMVATAAATDKIHFYRSNSSINIGDMNIEVFEFVCSGGSVCDSSSTSNLALADTLPWTPTTVLPVELVEFSVEGEERSAGDGGPSPKEEPDGDLDE